MFRLLGDLLVGWILFTAEGKQVANTVMTTAYNSIKSNIMPSNDVSNNETGTITIKDSFNRGYKNDRTNFKNNRTEDRRNISETGNGH